MKPDDFEYEEFLSNCIGYEKYIDNHPENSSLVIMSVLLYKIKTIISIQDDPKGALENVIEQLKKDLPND